MVNTGHAVLLVVALVLTTSVPDVSAFFNTDVREAFENFPFGEGGGVFDSVPEGRQLIRDVLPTAPAPNPVTPPANPPPAPMPPTSPPTPPPPPPPPPSPPALDCSPIPGCATCQPTGVSGGGIVCTSCSAGFALCPGGTVCKTCSAIVGCTECTCSDVNEPVACTDCGSNRFLDEDNDDDDFVPYCPLCLDIVAGCISCIDARPTGEADPGDDDDIVCTGCAGDLELDDGTCT